MKQHSFLRTQFGLIAVLLVGVVVFSSHSVAMAQTNSTGEQAGTQTVFSKNIFGIGLAGSACSGAGLSFRQHFASFPVSYQITGLAMKISGHGIYNIGLDAQYDFSVSTNRLYGVAGLGYYYQGDSTNDLASPFRWGAGFGYEIPLTGAIGIWADLRITVFEPQGNILPLPSAGIHIYFK